MLKMAGSPDQPETKVENSNNKVFGFSVGGGGEKLAKKSGKSKS